MFKITGFTKFQSRIDDLKDLPDKANELIKETLAKQHKDELKDAAHDTGFMKQSIYPRIIKGRLTTTGRLDHEAEYTIYQEYGTRYQSGQPFIRYNFYRNSKEMKEKAWRLVRE